MTSNLAVYLLRIYQTKIYVHIHMDAYSSLIYSIPKSEGLPQWLSGKESACNAGDTGLIPGVGKSPHRKWQPAPVFLLGKSHG